MEEIEQKLEQLGKAMPALKKIKHSMTLSGKTVTFPKVAVSKIHQTTFYNLRPFDRPLSKIIDYDQLS